MTEAATLQLDPELTASVQAAANWRGMSLQEFALAAISEAVRSDAELAALIKEGEDDIAAGRVFTQEEVEAMFGVNRERRDAA